jgi:hypothetical protein
MNTLSGIQSVILNKNPKRLPPTTPTALGGSLNPGTNGEVRVIHALNATNVYVGGNFTTADGIGVNYIAKWNGTSWTDMSGGANGDIFAIHALNETTVYIGGYFDYAGGNRIYRFARWNGSTWNAVGAGIPDSVQAIYAFSQTNIYAGGTFNSIGTTWVNRIARWNGTNWSDLQGGMWDGGSVIRSIAALNANWIYVCGRFTKAGNIASDANNIAIWDGSNFYKMGNGIPLTGNNFLNTIFVLNGNNVYVGGGFAYNGANNIIRWDGSQWQTMGSGLDGEVKGIYAFSPTNVYAVGRFPWGVARWDGMTWNVVGPGVTGVGQPYSELRVNTISATSPNNIYIGGLFTSSDGVTVNNILRLS